MHYVYILRCSDGSLYTGYAVDVPKRVAEHNTGKGAKYTKPRLPAELVASWQFESRSAALKEEFRIKHLSRAQKLQLIQSIDEA